MNQILQNICAELDALVTQLTASIPTDEPFNVAHGNWSFPGVSRQELIKVAADLAALIREQGSDTLGANEALISDYVRRLQFLRSSTVPQLWTNAGQAVPSYYLTLQSLRQAVSTALISDSKAESAATLKRITAQLRAMEARLQDLGPRTTEVAAMIERIEHASDAADQLPTDLEALKEARNKLAALTRESAADQSQISAAKLAADEVAKSLKQNSEEARAVLGRCESAYSAATSQGLAAAFAERSTSLNKSMWAWVVGLVGALAVGGFFGGQHLSELSALAKVSTSSPAAISVSVLLSLLSIGGPIWFAWLATKQIGQRFRLAEDYAFKASISRAYEGYRREAARVDPDLEVDLLKSALARFDELPLRLVEPVSHGSPWHELLSSDVVKDAVKSVPGFASGVKGMAEAALSKVGRMPVETSASQSVVVDSP